MSGEAILQAVAEFGALSSFVCRINGRQETPLDMSIMEAGLALHIAAFGEPTYTDDLTPLGLTAVVEERANAILAERLDL